MKKKALLIMMSSFVVVATATTVVFSSKYHDEDLVEAGSYTIVLDGECASNCHYDEENWYYRFELNGLTGSGQYPFSSNPDYTYFAEYSGTDNYILGGDNILTLGNPYGGNYVYLSFNFEGPGNVTEACALTKSSLSQEEYDKVYLSNNEDEYVFSGVVDYQGVLILHKIFFKYTC